MTLQVERTFYFHAQLGVREKLTEPPFLVAFSHILVGKVTVLHSLVHIELLDVEGSE